MGLRVLKEIYTPVFKTPLPKHQQNEPKHQEGHSERMPEKDMVKNVPHAHTRNKLDMKIERGPKIPTGVPPSAPQCPPREHGSCPAKKCKPASQPPLPCPEPEQRPPDPVCPAPKQ
ncbi:hypothetical protein O0L34_g16445 [Tuta absoluta]|nr:hypothetical protein O0L34_g16445 [Tuta absoluta]